jgi:hypothetical protein
VTLAAGQWLQLNQVLKQAGMTNAWATVERVGGVDPFYAYAVVNDNVTNDGSFAPPVALGRKAFAQMIPVAVNTAGFLTECVLVNIGTVPVTLQLGSSKIVALEAGEQRFIPDLFSFVGYQSGQRPIPVPIFSRSGTPESVFLAGARTFWSASGGGSYGLFYPAEPLPSFPAVPLPGGVTDEAWVHGIRQDGLARSNLAIVNWSGSYGGPAGGAPPRYSLTADVFDGETGLLAGSATVSLLGSNPDWIQINAVLAAFGVRNGYARVRAVGPGGGRFLVYGVVNDGAVPGQGTSDGSYLPMAVPLPPSPFPP